MNLTKMADKQQSLALKALHHPEWRIQNLYDLLHWDVWMEAAAQAVLSRPGSDTAGVDSQTRHAFREDYDSQMARLVTSLKDKSYHPLPIKRVYIPKPDGTQRPLGIPALRDRIVQEATRAILGPIYEAEFSPRSYGFRKGRKTMDAIGYIMPYFSSSNKYFYVLEGDLQSYFDTVHHRTLLKLLRRRINDRALLTLIGKFLKAGVLENGLFSQTSQGVPQGGVLSPLLSNVYLHEFDTWVTNHWPTDVKSRRQRRNQGLGNVQYVRYADDFVLLCNGPISQVRHIKEEIKDYLENQLHLTLNVEKTRITHINKGFDFLGFNIRRTRNHEDRWVTQLRPAAKNLDRIKGKIKELTSRSTTWSDPYTRLTTLNLTVQGWANYYRHTTLLTDIESVTRYTWFRYLAWLRKKFPTTGKYQLCRRYQAVLYNRKRWFATLNDGDTKSTVWQWQPTRKEYKRIRYMRKGEDSFPHPYVYPTDPTTDYSHSQGTDGPHSPNLTGYGYHYRGTPSTYDATRRLVLLRDNYSCTSCNSGKSLNVHHIKGLTSHDPTDLITLCHSCHRVTHDNAK